MYLNIPLGFESWQMSYLFLYLRSLTQWLVSGDLSEDVCGLNKQMKNQLIEYITY